MDNKQLKAIREECEKQGYSFQITRWPRKLTYYKPTGEAMPNLPSDPVTMQRYFNKGFTLVPPEELGELKGKPGPDVAQAVAVKEEKPSELTCSCGFGAKTKAGLKAHQRFCSAN